MISKDQSIVTQVAAKIAAELIIKTEDTTKNVAEWLTAFDAVKEALLEAHAVQTVTDAFPNAMMVTEATTSPNQYSKPSGSLAVAGQQHGDLPGWLVSACRKCGTTETRLSARSVRGSSRLTEPSMRRVNRSHTGPRREPDDGHQR